MEMGVQRTVQLSKIGSALAANLFHCQFAASIASRDVESAKILSPASSVTRTSTSTKMTYV